MALLACPADQKPRSGFFAAWRACPPGSAKPPGLASASRLALRHGVDNSERLQLIERGRKGIWAAALGFRNSACASTTRLARVGNIPPKKCLAQIGPGKGTPGGTG